MPRKPLKGQKKEYVRIVNKLDYNKRILLKSEAFRLKPDIFALTLNRIFH